MDLELEQYDANRVQGYVLMKETVDAWITKLSAMTLEERKTLKGLQPKRADVIVYGLIILQTVMELLQAETVMVSDRDLLYGLLER